MNILHIMNMAPVIPVITINNIEDAIPLAEALIEGGLPVLEITMRTDAALEAIAIIRKRFPDAVVGAGTVLNGNHLAQAKDSGAQFIVSPGCTESLLAAVDLHKIPILPGVSTASELMALLEHNINTMKFFPAEAAGGIGMLKALSAPLPQAIFCPTGGITPQSAPAYLALPNVACVGGSWMLKQAWIDSKQWHEVKAAALKAASLKAAG